jgi:hypothetical protein
MAESYKTVPMDLTESPGIDPRSLALVSTCGMPAAPVLWVVFSARTVPMGRFTFWRVMQGLPGYKLFVNCERNNWYADLVGPLPGMINRIRKELRIERTFYLGISMGAYASSLLGCRDPGSRTLSFSPNLVVGRPYTHSWYYTRGTGAHYESVFDSLDLENSKNFDIIWGGRDIADCSFAADMDDFHTFSGRVHVLRGGHTTSAFLENNGHLTRVLTSLYAGEALNLPVETLATTEQRAVGATIYKRYSDLVCEPDQFPGFYAREKRATRMFGIFRKLAYDLRFLTRLDDSMNVLKFGLSEMLISECDYFAELGETMLALGQLDDASLHLDHAVHLGAKNRVRALAAKAYERLKDFSEAARRYADLAIATESNRAWWVLAARNHRLAGDAASARKIIKQAQRHFPGDTVLQQEWSRLSCIQS